MSNKKKPELLVTAKNMIELQELIGAKADAILIGGTDYGLRLREDFTLEMIKEAVQLAHNSDVKLYILIDALFSSDMIVDLEKYLQALAEIDIDAIVLQDPAVLVLAKKYLPNTKLHISTGTTITNSHTVKFWAGKGVDRAVSSKELSLDEISYIKQQSDIEIEVQVQGLSAIFYSKRKLITNYFKYIEGASVKENLKDNLKEKLSNKELFLREQKRPDEKYPVYEDIHGTHVMSSYDISMIEHLDKLMALDIDSFKIEGSLYLTEDLVKITKLYRETIDKIYIGQSIDELIVQLNSVKPNDKVYDTGFYFKEQIY